MGLIEDFQRRESERIDKLYAKADCLEEGQLNDLIKYIFTCFYDAGFGGEMTAKALIAKVNRVLKINYMPKKGEYEKWHEEFCMTAFELKKSLLVTMANDLCKMNVFSEAQILGRFDEFLKEIPGVTMETADDEQNTKRR